MIFYTDVFGISAAAAGSMLFAIKIFNAFTDPMIGAVADRTQHPVRQIPSVSDLDGASARGGGGAHLQHARTSAGTGKLIWAYGTVSLDDGLLYAASISPTTRSRASCPSDPQQRSTINGLRFIFAFGGSMVVTGATPFLVKWLGGGNERLGWPLTMVFWGMAASGLFLLTFWNTRERIAPPPAQKTNVGQDVKDLAHNGPWMVLFFLALVIMMTITLRNATAAYYFKYVCRAP